MNEKSEAFSKFKAFKALLEKETGKNLKCPRSDQGGEFTLDEMKKEFEMSLIGEMQIFIGFQVQKLKGGILSVSPSM